MKDKVLLCAFEIFLVGGMIYPIFFYTISGVIWAGLMIYIYFEIMQSIKNGEQTLVYKFVKGENNGRR